MKTTLIIYMFVVVLLGLLLSGCTTTEYTLYLQDVTIKGPMSQPPVHISNNNTEKPLCISPHIEFNANKNRNLVGQIEGHSKVDASGKYQVDPTINGNIVTFRERPGANNLPFAGNNLRWLMPSASFGIDVDYTKGAPLALSFGASYSTVDGEGLWGYSFGLGLYSETNKSALRVEGGVRWQELLYEAATVVVKRTSSSSNEEVGFFRDRGKDTPLNFYGTLTFNTKQDWLLNIFVQVAISKQSLAKFKPSVAEPVLFIPFPIPVQPNVIVHDQRAEFSSTFAVLTPGVYVNVDASTRLLFGARIHHQTEITNSTPDTIVLPFVQLDWMF